MRKHYYLPLLVLLTISTVSAQLPGPSIVVADSLQKIIQDACTKYGVPGGVLEVYKPGQWQWAGGYGTASINPATVTVQPDYRFKIASISKTFTASIILQLASDGKLKLSDTIGPYLRESLRNSLVDSIPNLSNITIRHLLNHTAGFGNTSENSTYSNKLTSQPSKTMTIEELITYAIKAAPSGYFLPGAGWHYSNGGYQLLSVIAANAADSSYADLVTVRIINRLGLTNTVYPVDATIPVTQSPPNRLHCVTGPYGLKEATDYTYTAFVGSGEMISNADELQKHAQQIISDSAYYSQAWRDSVMTFVNATGGPNTDSLKWGLGVLQAWTKSSSAGCAMSYIGHGGNLPGTSAGMYYVPELDVYIVFDLEDVNGQLDGVKYISCPVYNLLKSPLGLEETIGHKENGLHISPVPSTGAVTIEFHSDTHDTYSLEIFDVTGKCIHREPAVSDGKLIWQYDFSRLSSGIYLARIVSSEKIYQKKFVLAGN